MLSPSASLTILSFSTAPVTVHARDCRLAFQLDPERMIDVDWESGGIERRVAIRVTSRDEPGLLADITRAISTAGVNISSAAIDRPAVAKKDSNVAATESTNSERFSV